MRGKKSRRLAVIQQDHDILRQYLLGQLAETDDETIEVRLLSDAGYAEEMDIIVNELIDEYVEDELSAKEREQAEQHFFKSSERIEKLKFALALKRRKSELIFSKHRPRKIFTIYLPIAASLLLVAGLSFVVWRTYSNQSELNKGLLALQAAFRERRPLETRISGFSYAPLSVQRGDGKGTEKEDYLQRDKAASHLQSAVNDKPAADSHHALGQYYLAEHQYDKAIDQFQTSLNLDPQSAKTHSDMGVAQFEIGKLHSSDKERGEGVKEFANSLDHFNKALVLNGSLLEALFNRALLYEQMGLLEQAEKDWRLYIEKDPQSKWTDEARLNLIRVEEQRRKASQTPNQILQEVQAAYESHHDEVTWSLLSGYYNRSGNVIVEQLLDGYLEATKDPTSDKDRHLKLLSYVGEIEKQRSGDLFFSKLAQFYQSTTTKQQAKLITARGLVKEAHGGWGRVPGQESIDLFSRAKRLFDEAGDTCESETIQYWISFCYFRQRHKAQTFSILTPLISTCESKSYKHLLARALYLQSISQFDILNELSKAIDSANRSLDLAEQIRDTVGALNALSSLIEYFRHLGNYDKALSYVQRSLPWINHTSIDPIQGSRFYGFVATALASAGLYSAAAEYQREAVRFALSTANASVMSSNYVFLGMINAKLKNYGEALGDFKLAYDTAQGHSGEESDRGLMAYASLKTGDLYRLTEDFDNAIASYTRALELYDRMDQPTDLYHAHKGRALCYVSQGKDQLAQEEITKALSLIEDYRVKIVEENNRESFFDDEQSLYDLAIDFAYSREKDAKEAFRLSESSRARSLLDLINSDALAEFKNGEQRTTPPSVSKPLSLEEIQNQLPEQTQILQYAVLEHKLIIWSVSNQGISSTSRDLNQDDLNEKVLDYLQSVSSSNGIRSDDELTRAKDLYDILIKPAESWLDKNKQICIVPDKVLNFLPFSMLVSSVSGRYLIEDYLFVDSPSSTLFVRCSEIARQKESIKTEKLLAVGNPRFDRNAFPSLSDLPSAGKEARDVAMFYHSAPPLIGPDAKAEAVKSEMQKANVMHLALHSVLDSEFPLRSKLLLAEDATQNGTERDGALRAYEIYGMRLSQARLVILSACRTGAERYYKGEGMISLTRAFLAARVPLVVSSLWPVDSDATSELMVSFHRYRKTESLSTAEALRKAQLTMLGGANERRHHPYYWAPFVVIGGYARF